MTVDTYRRLGTELASVGRFSPAAPYQRLAYACGALLVLSGSVHGVVFLVDGGAWAGPLSWRKPVVFGLSFGITVTTLGWVIGLLRMRRGVAWAATGLLGSASVAEVALITMQTWRGVPSHFNVSTPFDAAVFSAMGALVTIVAAVAAGLTLRSFGRMDAAPSLAWAVRAGLLLVLLSQAVGGRMIAAGGSTMGAAGSLKLPHAVTLHAVQVLPALALVLLLSTLPERARVRVVAVGAVGYAALVAAVALQAYAGKGPTDVDAVPAVLGLGGITLLVGCAATALGALVRTLRGVRYPGDGGVPDPTPGSEPQPAGQHGTAPAPLVGSGHVAATVPAQRSARGQGRVRRLLSTRFR
jgi:hypothetical protein